MNVDGFDHLWDRVRKIGSRHTQLPAALFPATGGHVDLDPAGAETNEYKLALRQLFRSQR